jgi:hypothetical protein
MMGTHRQLSWRWHTAVLFFYGQSGNLSLFSRTLFTFLAIRVPHCVSHLPSMISALECRADRQHDPYPDTLNTPDLTFGKDGHLPLTIRMCYRTWPGACMRPGWLFVPETDQWMYGWPSLIEIGQSEYFAAFDNGIQMCPGPEEDLPFAFFVLALLRR